MPDLTVAQNLRLTRRRLRARCAQSFARMELDVDFAERARRRAAADAAHARPRARARRASRSCCCSTRSPPRCRPTSPSASSRSCASRRERGRSVLFITHRLNEVIAPCDRATDPARRRRGRRRSCRRKAARSAIVEHMLGAEAARAAAAAVAPDEPSVTPAPAHDDGARRRSRWATLAVGGVCRASRSRSGAGEILGIAALEGQGQDELFAALSGQRSAGRRRDRRQRRARCRRAIRTTRSAPASCSCPPTACTRCCRSARCARTSRRRATTASLAGARSTCATSGGASRRPIDALQIDIARAAPGAPALGRQPAEGDDRALARLRLQRRCSASTRRAASTSARSARSTRSCAGSPTTAPRSSSSRASWPSSRSSATAC